MHGTRCTTSVVIRCTIVTLLKTRSGSINTIIPTTPPRTKSQNCVRVRNKQNYRTTDSPRPSPYGYFGLRDSLCYYFSVYSPREGGVEFLSRIHIVPSARVQTPGGEIWSEGPTLSSCAPTRTAARRRCWHRTRVQVGCAVREPGTCRAARASVPV